MTLDTSHLTLDTSYIIQVLVHHLAQVLVRVTKYDIQISLLSQQSNKHKKTYQVSHDMGEQQTNQQSLHHSM